MAASNALISDRFVDFLLFEVCDAAALCELEYFSDHSKDTFILWLQSCRRLARETLFPAYRPMDLEGPELINGRMKLHPAMTTIWKSMAEMGVINASRPYEVGGQQLPLAVAALSNAYLGAANTGAFAFAGLTTGAAHLIEAFAQDPIKARYLEPMYTGKFNGTMALTEPNVGSSLGDITTKATPISDHPHGGYKLKGSKIFISGGDQDFAENTVHLVLARIEGAPMGSRGVSLFAVPRMRPTENNGETTWVDNDVSIAGAIHKIGWKGIPSLVLSFGESDNCIGELVGPENQGLRCMFQMMNEARLMVGLGAAATASVAYQESLHYARERTQGRAFGVSDPTVPMVALIEHPDVRRMLIRQKCIVEGSLCLLAQCARYADLSEHHSDPAVRSESKNMLELLIPIAKSFPAEFGFESNALAVQIHGGYGYSSEYLPESWMRDQKLNSIHEGTTGIQALDLLGRKVVAQGGAVLMQWMQKVQSTVDGSSEMHLSHSQRTEFLQTVGKLMELTQKLGMSGVQGDLVAMLSHATDYLRAMSILVIGWQWIEMVNACHSRDDEFTVGMVHSCHYWLANEVPIAGAIIETLLKTDHSFVAMNDGNW